MKAILQNARPIGVFLTILMLIIAVPFDSVFAAMVETEVTLELTRAKQARDDINKLLLREDVQNALMAQGINPIEAKARIDSLSDDEVIQIANEINELSAGAGGMFAGGISPSIPVWIIVAAIAAVVLIIVGIVYLATSD
jgi:hypothetical protein